MGVRHAAGTHLRWAALLGACVCMLGFAHGSYARIPVTVNEVTVSARPGETVGAVIDAVGGYESPKILADRNVPATFFMLGSCVDKRPAVARAVVQAGHAVGNHTYRHTRLDATTPTTAEWEIRATNWAIQQATGARPHWLRAPGGRLEGPAAAYISASGMASALWTVDPQDWRKEATSAGIADTVIRSVRPGAIVVLHDGGGDRSATIAALPVIIDRLRAAGYEFVTLDEMPAVRATW